MLSTTILQLMHTYKYNLVWFLWKTSKMNKYTLILIFLSCVIANENLGEHNDCNTIGTTQSIASLNSFDITSFGNYTGTGLHDSKTIFPVLSLSASSTHNPVVWGMDTTHQRLFINHTVNVHWFFRNESYFYIPAFGLCFFRPDYNYTTHVQNYLQLSDVGATLERDQGVGGISAYSGWIHDQHACPELRIGVYVAQNKCGAVSRWVWTGPLRVPALGLNSIVEQAVWLNDIKKENPPEHMFDQNVVAACQNPTNFYAFFGCSSTVQIN